MMQFGFFSPNTVLPYMALDMLSFKTWWRGRGGMRGKRGEERGLGTMRIALPVYRCAHTHTHTNTHKHTHIHIHTHTHTHTHSRSHAHTHTHTHTHTNTYTHIHTHTHTHTHTHLCRSVIRCVHFVCSVSAVAGYYVG